MYWCVRPYVLIHDWSVDRSHPSIYLLYLPIYPRRACCISHSQTGEESLASHMLGASMRFSITRIRHDTSGIQQIIDVDTQCLRRNFAQGTCLGRSWQLWTSAVLTLADCVSGGCSTTVCLKMASFLESSSRCRAFGRSNEPHIRFVGQAGWCKTDSGREFW